VFVDLYGNKWDLIQPGPGRSALFPVDDVCRRSAMSTENELYKLEEKLWTETPTTTGVTSTTNA
jgi:hypothetical protein